MAGLAVHMLQAWLHTYVLVAHACASTVIRMVGVIRGLMGIVLKLEMGA